MGGGLATTPLYRYQQIKIKTKYLVVKPTLIESSAISRFCLVIVFLQIREVILKIFPRFGILVFPNISFYYYSLMNISKFSL